MKNLVSLFLVSAMAVSCVNLTGNLSVHQSMNVKKKGGFLNLQTKTATIEAGSYIADLKINSERSITLKIRTNKEDGKDILIPIKSDESLNLPTNGKISIAGAKISQPFNLEGTIATAISDSESIRSTEGCTFTRMENHCEKVCTQIPTSDRTRSRVVCDIQCHDVQVTFNGTRYVEYHTRYTDRNLTAILSDVDSKAELATFTASGRDADRITDYYGECR